MEVFRNSDMVEQRIAATASQIPVEPFWRPSADFVICRDDRGLPTAVYSGPIWDLSPIRLMANRIQKISFESIFEEPNSEQSALVEEVRYLLFCLLFYVQAGRLGRVSAETLVKYFVALRRAARYCSDLKSNPLIGALSLQQLLTNPVYLDGYSHWMVRNKIGRMERKTTRALLKHMVSMGEQRLGYKIQGVFHLKFGSDDGRDNQTPIIPTRIYLGIINATGDVMNDLYEKRDSIEEFIKAFLNPLYGYTRKNQSKFSPGLERYEPDFNEALRIHGVDQIFTGDLACVGRNNLSGGILKIQWILKTVIHLYTGMRDQEVMRLVYNCIDSEDIVAPTVNEDGVTVDNAMTVKVLSTTTKYTGYRKAASWLATEEVVRAVEILRSICRGVSSHFNMPPDDMPLFLTPGIFSVSSNNVVKVAELDPGNKPKLLTERFIITEADFQELQASDPGRDFSQKAKFRVGSPWPFASHQFRRSLAFFGSNSGFISLPTLRKQFKHLTMQMSRYYTNNFDKLKTIFGYYDEEAKDFVLPENHVLFEYQTGVPMSIAYDLLDHAFGSDAPIFGGTGTYISNQRKKMEQGDIHIADIRRETEKLAAEGKISHKVTLLGSCTAVDRCDSYLLGDASSCLSCKDGIIDKCKLEGAIKDDEADLALYEPGSGEYQVVEAELDSLKKFHQKFIAVVEV
ncbi:integrase [Pseudomonas sp. HY13-MNA-CIBAN-0226]|uniref:integrase n=1 Tax=Pseudomonas sp. HY13-MNA-CIBAN-0226 TaxID=3140473 RepID=UPI00331B84BC